jgi:CRP/FNR family transcriptional regulator, cyclic AMP receptor protein
LFLVSLHVQCRISAATTRHSRERNHGKVNRIEVLAGPAKPLAFDSELAQREEVKRCKVLRSPRNDNRRQGFAIRSVSAMNPELLPNPSASGLADLGQIRWFPKHAVILNDGNARDSFYVILSGRVKFFLSDEKGREIVLGTGEPIDFVGEMALDGGPRSASVMCLDPSCFSVVTRTSLRRAIAADPDIAFKLLSTVISRARLMTDMVKNLALLDVCGRVARLLLGLAVEEADGTLVVSETLTQQNIADRVGASRDMVNCIVRNLSAGGYIAVTRRKFRILRRPLPAGDQVAPKWSDRTPGANVPRGTSFPATPLASATEAQMHPFARVASAPGCQMFRIPETQSSVEARPAPPLVFLGRGDPGIP